MEVREIVRPELLSLAKTTKQVVSFGILDNEDVVYIDRVQSNAFRLGVDIRIGTRIPTYYTAIGKSILAFLSQEKSLNILKKQELIDPYSKQKIELEKSLESCKQLEKKDGATLNLRQRFGFWHHQYWTKVKIQLEQ